MRNVVLKLWHKLESRPFGKRLFAWIICRKAPYFASIAPRMVSLAPGRGEATLAHRRAVTNHIGTVHAIALCNLAEFVGGLTCDVSIPATMRWIPKGMTVEYRKKAVGLQRAVATPAFTPHDAADGYDLPMDVVVTNPAGDTTFTARIAMWVSPSARKAG